MALDIGGWGSAIGGGLIGSFLGGGGGSSGGQAPTIAPLTASGMMIDQLFGITRGVATSGSDKGQAQAYYSSPGVIDREKFLQGIADYMQQALPTSETERAAGRIGDLSTGQLPGSLEMLDIVSKYALEGAETGFRQDISSVIPLAENIYQDLGDITAERFAGSNILQSGGTTGFPAQRMREAKDISVELGALQFGEDQAAAERRLNLLLGQVVPNLAEGRLGLPLNYANQLFGFGERQRLSQEQIRGRPYESLMALSGIQPPALTQFGYPASDAGGLSGLADVIGPLMSMGGGSW